MTKSHKPQLVLCTESATSLATKWFENMKRKTTPESVRAFEAVQTIQKQATKILRERPSRCEHSPIFLCSLLNGHTH
jgi:hypothetical protein